jgi:hypothetical protein
MFERYNLGWPFAVVFNDIVCRDSRNLRIHMTVVITRFYQVYRNSSQSRIVNGSGISYPVYYYLAWKM